MKKGWKIFTWILVVLVVLYLGGELGWGVRYALEPQRQIQIWVKFGEDLHNLYQQDKYGGQTPEETLALFVQALERGDTDLASKYFILDKQEQEKEDLAKMKAEGNLGGLVSYVKRAVKDKEDEDSARFYIKNQDPSGLSGMIVLGKNNSSGVWKISMI